MAEYDFIIVGSGPSGSTIASRLARSSKAPSVLLLEAGGPNADREIMLLPERFLTAFVRPEMNWGYKTAPQEVLENRSIDFDRGKGLGGSSAVNFCCWTTGPNEDYDQWARIVGDDTFNSENSRRRLKKIERFNTKVRPEYQPYATVDPAIHGTSGSIDIEFGQLWDPPLTKTLDAINSSGYDRNLDINSGNPLGIGINPATARNSLRCTARVAFLTDPPSNLAIRTDSPVTKLVFEEKRTIGVIANEKTYKAKNEVIVCAGALDSPKLLLLSGIGPKDELAVHGIESVYDLPGVGKNLQDHPIMFMSMQARDGFDNHAALFTDARAHAAAREQLFKDGSGPLASIYAMIIMGFYKNEALFETAEFKALPASTQARILSPTSPTGELMACMAPLPHANKDRSYITLCASGMAVQSRGAVTLASTNPQDPPVCDPKMLTHPWDRLNWVDNVKRLHAFFAIPDIAKETVAPFHVPESASDEDIWTFTKKFTGSTWHMSSTVMMGKDVDEMACVDTRFKVKGVEGLRVADMSVTPFVPSCHTVAWAYQIGEIASERLIEEYGLEG
ncbi:GMC oxidoreductase [Patellaria atrata CBS 101060]|uniref:GMC oxidoreductase n=1 Tax=Patellaria atrata CBS 101060 TaxID=1346257 RepID=A0A9P4VUU1_9PEZI|nr:GMC oxidoreductase [Patellaria atrata CBS 101060]